VPITPEIEIEVIRIYQQTRRSPFKTARQVGVPVQDVFDIVARNKEQLESSGERFGGEGRPDIKPYTVARRRVAERGWDNSLPEIIQARAEYEAGTHEMATGRDGAWLILYSIPRARKVAPRKGYFLPEEV
jgi:hypothetical protein